jgi:hypothetical protein
MVLYGGFAVAEQEHELAFGLDYTDMDSVGKTGTLSGEFLFPLGRYALLGPAIGYTYIKSPGGNSVDTLNWTALLEFNFTDDGNGLFAGAGATYFDEDVGDIFDWSAEARLGIKAGPGAVFVKAFASYERLFAGLADVEDQDFLGVQAFIGWRL